MVRKKSAMAIFAEKVKVDKDSLTKKLLSTPARDPDKPHRTNMIAKDGMVQQADVIYLQPDDSGHKHALVVVDVATGKTAARPIHAVSSREVTKAFKDIYASGDLKFPKVFMQVDNGGEFKDVTKKYFDNKGTVVRYGKPHRSRMQAYAENRNLMIGKMVSLHQHSEELKWREEHPNVPAKEVPLNTQWVDDLPMIIDAINEVNVHKPYKPSKTKPNMPICSKSKNGKVDSCILLKIGQRVRYILDVPRDTSGKVLHGKFRAGDLRWSQSIHTIENILIKPTQPPLYQISGMQPAYTKAQLMVVKAGEKGQVVLPKEKAPPKKKAPPPPTEEPKGRRTGRARKGVDRGFFVE